MFPFIGQVFRPISVGLVVLFCSRWTAEVRSAEVYRCLMPDGQVRFSATRDSRDCQVLGADNPKTGWDAGMPLPPADEPAEGGGKRSSVQRKSSSADPQGRRKETACQRKRTQLERVEWKLKRGYKASEGPRLRRQVREVEDYLRDVLPAVRAGRDQSPLETRHFW